MKLLIVILFFTSSFILSQNIKDIKKLNEDNSPASAAVLIERAYANKKIDLDKRVLYLTYYLYDYSKLPEKFKSDSPEKCGTWIASIIFNNLSKIKKETREVVQSYSYRK